MVKYRPIVGQLAIEACGCAGTNDFSFDIKLVFHLLLPLFAEMRQADHGKTFDFTPFHHLPDNHQGFDGFAYTDVVSYQQPDRILLESHDKRDNLIRSGPESQFSHTTERAAGIPK